jgi:hypothetical protein
VGTGAVGTRGTPEAALSREVDARAPGTRGAPRAALSREVGARAAVTCGGLRAPPTPLPRPSMCGQSVVVPVTPPNNPHRMITRGETSFRVVPDRLVLTTAPLHL